MWLHIESNISVETAYWQIIQIFIFNLLQDICILFGQIEEYCLSVIFSKQAVMNLALADMIST